MCRGDGSCIVFVLAKGSRAVPKLRKPSRAERDDVTFDDSQRMLCTMTPSWSVADVVLSRFDLRTTCMCEQVLAQRPNCGAPQGLWEVGRALSSAHSTLASTNRQCPRPAEEHCFWRAERRRVDHWVSENRRWSAVRVNKRNALKTVTKGWCKKETLTVAQQAGQRHRDSCLVPLTACPSFSEREPVALANAMLRGSPGLRVYCEQWHGVPNITITHPNKTDGDMHAACPFLHAPSLIRRCSHPPGINEPLSHVPSIEAPSKRSPYGKSQRQLPRPVDYRPSQTFMATVLSQHRHGDVNPDPEVRNATRPRQGWAWALR